MAKGDMQNQMGPVVANKFRGMQQPGMMQRGIQPQRMSQNMGGDRALMSNMTTNQSPPPYSGGSGGNDYNGIPPSIGPSSNFTMPDRAGGMSAPMPMQQASDRAGGMSAPMPTMQQAPDRAGGLGPSNDLRQKLLMMRQRGGG